MRKIAFSPTAFGQFNEWRLRDKKTQDKIIKLIQEVVRTPFIGIGKPEALKGNYAGFWSRRIDEKHRLVYEVTDTSINIISCYSHYNEK